MNHPQAPQRVVVGIDGSDAAINAAEWAVIEATSRDLPLRLVHGIPERRQDGSAGDESLDIEYGETVLREACAAVHALSERVKIEADLVHGSPGSVLIDESRHAAMICVGSVGIGQVARTVIGSTAASIAQNAHCPVAVIRTNRDTGASPSGSIAVVVDDSPENDAALEYAFREARLRQAPILAMGVWRWELGEGPYHQLDDRLSRWVAEYHDVDVRPVAAPGGAAEFLASTLEPVQLAIVGGSESSKVAQMVGPVNPHFGRSGCSVLVVRK